jgi:hypothetical protein
MPVQPQHALEGLAGPQLTFAPSPRDDNDLCQRRVPAQRFDFLLPIRGRQRLGEQNRLRHYFIAAQQLACSFAV